MESFQGDREFSQEPGPTLLQTKLLREASRSLVILIGELTTSSKAEEDIPNVQAIDRFRELLEEISSLWEQNKYEPPRQYMLSTCAAELEAVLETFCDFLYRLTARYNKPIYGHFRECVIIVVTHLLNWTRSNHAVQKKLLTNGLLFTEVKSIELLISFSEEKEALLLMSYHLQLLHRCFVLNDFCVVYKFSEKHWTSMIQQLVAAPNQCVKLLSKSLACLFCDILQYGQELMALDESDIKILCGHMSSCTIEAEIFLPDFNSAITTKELVILLKSFCVYIPNQEKLLGQPTLLPTIYKHMTFYENDISCKKLLFTLLLELTKCPIFESAFTQSSVPFVQVVLSNTSSHDLSLRTISSVLLCCLQNQTPESVFIQHIQDITKQLLKCIDSNEFNKVSDIVNNYDQSLCNLLNLAKDLLEFSNEIAETQLISNLVAVLLKVASKLFTDLVSTGSIPLSLPSILYTILCWSIKYKKLRYHMAEDGLMLAESVHQLKVLGNFKTFTWFNRFLVNINLAIIYNCLQGEDICSQIEDINWPLILLPWLKCSEQETRLLAFTTACCLSHHFYDEDQSLFRLNKDDTQALLALLTNAVETPHLKTSLFCNMIHISALQLFMSLKLLIINLKLAFKPKKVFEIAVNLLVSGGLPEIQMVCNYICVTKGLKGIDFKLLIENCELPVIEILEQLQEIEDAEIKSVSERAILAIESSHTDSKDEGDSTQQIQNYHIESANIVIEMLGLRSLNFSVYEEKCANLNQILLKLRSLYVSSSTEEKKATGDIIASSSSIAVILNFMCKLSEHMITTKTDTVFLQSLNILLSCLVSFSDCSVRMRYRIMRTELLVHLANVISFFSDVSDNEEMVIKQMVLNCSTVISNCAQEHDFSLLYTPPGVVDWASLIESWIISPLTLLRFNAKILAGYIEKNLNEDMLFLLDLTVDEASTLLQMLSDSSVSDDLVGEGFGCRYSSRELLVMLNKLILSKNNYSLILQEPYIDILINSFMNLIARNGESEKKEVCRILLLLINSAIFKKRLKRLDLAGFLSVLKSNFDPCMRFLSQCVCLYLQQDEVNVTDFYHHHTIHYSTNCLPEICTYFEEILTSLTDNIKQITDRYANRKLNVSLKRFPKFKFSIEILKEVHDFWKLSSSKVKEAIGILLSNQSHHLEILHIFCMKVYGAMCIGKGESALHNGENEMLGPCFVQLSLCFLSWVQDSKKVCDKFIEMGLLTDYVKILSGSRLTHDTKFERFVVTTYLNILLECVQVPQIRVYYHKLHWFKAINRWIFCTHQELRLISKFVIGYLASTCEVDTLLALSFSEDDAQTTLSLLHDGSEKSQISSKYFFFDVSTNTLLNSIRCLLLLICDYPVLKEHMHELLDILKDEGAVKCLFKIVTKGSITEKVKACHLLWILSYMERSAIDSKVEHLHRIADQPNTEDEVKILCECVMISLDGTRLSDFCTFEAYAKWCYTYILPDLCISICDKVINHKFECSLESIHLLKGKSYYLKYIKEMRKLRLSSLSEDMKKQQYELCFKPNKLAIESLGKAFDQGFIDDEGTYMLDRAMMDCVFKSNMLHHCNRCYLCRRKLQGKEKLIKSHIIPHAILDASSTESKGSKQTIYASGSSISKANSRLLAPGEMVYHMLCQDCEILLSINGETQFSPKFFQKIYDKGEESDLAIKGQKIAYDPWLHQFCVGLVFRAMHWDVDEYLNDDIIYAKFKQCRAHISSWSNGEESIAPRMYIFISPVSVGINNQLQHKYINWFLRATLNKCFGGEDSKNVSLLLSPSFFVVQMGIINVLVDFDQSLREEFNQFVINPLSGMYSVPPHIKRKESMPSALWQLLLHTSELLENLLLKSDPVISVRPKGQVATTSSDEDLLNIDSGMAAAAIGTLTERISNLQNKRDHSLLPTQFSITSTPKKMDLPKGHKILLHSNYVRGPKSGSTFFIVVGNGKKYPINKPYVIWHFYEPTGTVTSGAFFSIHNLQVIEFLLSSKTIDMKAMSDRSFLTAKERMPTIIKELLEEKGFSSIVSLLHRVKTVHETGREFPPFDTKCKLDRKCWYCKFLCQNCCLNHAAYGRMSAGPHGTYIFCSESCQILSPEFFKSPKIHLISPFETPPSGIYIHCSPIGKCHQEVVHLHIRRLNKQNFPCEIEFAVYIGDGTESYPINRPYVVFYSHHLCHQLFVEFFINTELLAEEPLPQIANETSWNMILQLNEANVLQKCLEQAELLETTILQLTQLSQKPSDCDHQFNQDCQQQA